jgi:hypothetical protein
MAPPMPLSRASGTAQLEIAAGRDLQCAEDRNVDMAPRIIANEVAQ